MYLPVQLQGFGLPKSEFSPGPRQTTDIFSGMGSGLLVNAVICGAAGYFVGKHTGSPIGTAAASAIFGLPGMFVATLLAPKDGR